MTSGSKMYSVFVGFVGKVYYVYPGNDAISNYFVI